jgi:hypothetical protein
MVTLPVVVSYRETPIHSFAMRQDRYPVHDTAFIINPNKGLVIRRQLENERKRKKHLPRKAKAREEVFVRHRYRSCSKSPLLIRKPIEANQG